jgi:hypothetical protein
MDYRYQLNKIQDLNIGLGQSYRGDCVFCLNRNTLSVRHENGRLVWNCFHANCTAKGMTDSELRAEDLDKFINPSKIEPSKEFVIPKHFVTVFGNNKAREYLESFGISDTEARLMYDVKQNRLVFLVEDNGTVVGAVGRMLHPYSNTAPKWYKYGTPPVPFIVGTNKYIGFIVEDCISACKVALAGFTGIALMGTSIPDNFVSPIVDRIDRAFVCLDRDATEKSFKLRDCLSHVIPTQIKMIDKDLKWLSVEELKEWGNKICETL